MIKSVRQPELIVGLWRNVRASGFTLVEILVVLTLIALLAGLAAPVVSNAILRAEESALKENLSVMRRALDDYYADKGRYPESLGILVEERYLRFVPEDPVAGSSGTWQFEFNTDDNIGGIENVFSGSQELSRDGIRYGEW